MEEQKRKKKNTFVVEGGCVRGRGKGERRSWPEEGVA